MKILFYTASGKSVLPYLTEDVIDAFRELNQELEVIDILSPPSPKTLFSMGKDIIDSFKPDFVFSLSSVGLPIPLLKKLKIPHVSWFTIDPTFLLKPQDVSPYYYLFVVDRSLIQRLKRRGFEHVYYLPLATNPKIFKPLFLEKGELFRYSCDLSFAGTCDRSIGFREKRKEIYKFFGEKTVTTLINLKANFPLKSIVEIYKEIVKNNKASFKDKDPKVLYTYLKFIEFEAMVQFRKGVIRTIVDFGIHLYGDSGWKEIRHPKVFFHDRIDNRRELPKLYNATKINLNIPVSSVKEAVNMSTFDIPACGSFMLSSYRPDLVRLFKEGEEVVCFRNVKELRDKIDYYLKNEKERKEIATNAYERVIKEHTFKHRMKEVIEIMERVCSKGV